MKEYLHLSLLAPLQGVPYATFTPDSVSIDLFYTDTLKRKVLT